VMSQNPNSKAISVAGPFQGPLSMLLYHASFQGAVQNLVGPTSRVTPFDGFVILKTDSDDPKRPSRSNQQPDPKPVQPGCTSRSE
jgi:hypothetical protein